MGDVTIADIAGFLGQEVADNTVIKSAKPIADAKVGDMTMIRSKLDNPNTLISQTQASLIIADEGIDFPDGFETPIIVSKNARLDFIRVLNQFFVTAPTQSIHPSAVIGDNVTIGEGTIIHPNVTLYDNVTIGRNCTVHSGCVIGADGFGFERTEENDIVKFPHIGGVVIGDNVEIQGLTHVARGTLGNTIIGDETKIDAQCHIAHNCVIGKRCLIAAGVTFGGSVTVGNDVYIAPSASILNKITIGDKAFIGMASFVNRDVESGVTVIGSPARKHIKK